MKANANAYSTLTNEENNNTPNYIIINGDWYSTDGKHLLKSTRDMSNESNNNNDINVAGNITLTSNESNDDTSIGGNITLTNTEEVD